MQLVDQLCALCQRDPPVVQDKLAKYAALSANRVVDGHLRASGRRVSQERKNIDAEDMPYVFLRVHVTAEFDAGLVVGSCYIEILPHIYRHLDTTALLSSALLSSLRQRPELALCAESIAWDFYLVVMPAATYSFEEDDTADLENETTFEHRIIKEGLAAAQEAAQERNATCLRVLRHCHNVKSLTCRGILDHSTFLRQVVLAELPEYTPFPSQQNLLALPFLSNLNAAAFHHTPLQLDFVRAQDWMWDWSVFRPVLQACIGLQTLTIPAMSDFLPTTLPSVLHLDVEHQLHDWPAECLSDYSLEPFRSICPALRILGNHSAAISTRLETTDAASYSARILRLTFKSRDSWHQWDLEQWLEDFLSDIDSCETLLIDLHRSAHMCPHEDTSGDIRQIISLLAAQESVASTLKSLSFVVYSNQYYPKEEVPDFISNFIPCDSLQDLFIPDSFPNLRHVSLRTSLDSHGRALQMLGIDKDQLGDRFSKHRTDAGDYQLVSNFRKLASLTASSRADLVLEWHLEPADGAHMWTAIRCIKKQAGRTTVYQDNSMEAVRRLGTFDKLP